MDVLFSRGSSKNTVELTKDALKDLAIPEIAERACSMKEEREIVLKVFSKLPTDIADIRFRSEVMQDLIANKELCDRINECAYEIFFLKNYGGSYRMLRRNDINLYTLLEDLRELSVYTAVTEKLASTLHEYEIRSDGLIAIRDELDKTVNNENFAELKRDLDEIRKDLSTVQGAIIGVNFTSDLDIDNVSAIEFVPNKIVSKYGIVERLTAFRFVDPNEHSTRKARIPDPLLAAIAPKLQVALKKHYADILKAFNKYADFDTRSITEMYEGLIFYVAMARFGRGLKDKGYELCFPDISEKKGFEVKGLYNIRLAIDGEKDIVKNDFTFSEDERIFILTGPNRGGKTIIEQAIGITSFMAAHGLFVTASSFTGRPFGNILTHFPIDENLTINYGRLGEEAIRIKDIVNNTDENTLILFNETYSTTSATDGVYLSKDLIRVLKEKGAYVIFNTHLHELARDIPEMDKWDGQGNIISIVMERKDGRNTFMLKRAAPDTTSYARNIAEKYGITYEQMTDKKTD